MKLEIETPAIVKRTIGATPKEKGKSLPKNQRGPQVKHLCHHCGIQGHTRSNCSKFRALKKADSIRDLESSKRRSKVLGHMCFSCYRTYVMILCNWLIL